MYILLLMKNIFLISIFSFFSSLLFSQEYIAVKGVVKDEQTNFFLPFTNISIKGKNMGTHSNEKGQFHFKMENKYQLDTFCISFMGYETLEIPVQNLKLNNKNFEPYFLKKKIFL